MTFWELKSLNSLITLNFLLVMLLEIKWAFSGIHLIGAIYGCLVARMYLYVYDLKSISAKVFLVFLIVTQDFIVVGLSFLLPSFLPDPALVIKLTFTGFPFV